ncbi:urease beta subunit [Halarchaeum acidiphilum MH1-52-1]|uniref:Urease subunit beta n=1 Tax=Halarchaeum acidiphilum MH1-52-1 TaxID=1261545 RepID=U2YXE9_9EURY|nr:urease subunit beta [Halarchaeum acidiphilum]GAD53462.1 urease beta subunit [Halarchaeum acidiphilum MH1-52-1]
MSERLVPGEIVPGEGDVTINEGRETATVTVANTGDRPVQVGSHFHFFEANAALAFDREAAFGMRLNVPAGTAVRFEPGDERDVDLVAIGGKGRAHGMNGLVNGSVTVDPAAALERLRDAGFADTGAGDAE